MDAKADKISDMESELMKVVWKKGEPITYTEIRSALNMKHNLGSQSIQTMLKRLVQKEILEQEKRDVYYYSALVTEAEYTKSKTLSLVKKVFSGNAKDLMSALISYNEVSPEDVEELQRFWKAGKDNDE